MAENSNSKAKREKNVPDGRMPEFDPGKIRIVAGLGNPEDTYAATYHNAGFLAVDRLSDSDAETAWKKEDRFFYIKSGKIVFLKPSVFMNESGTAIREALRYFKAEPENLVVCHDDSDIETGSYKIAFGRGPAGHRGVASVISHIKTKDFWRVRIGVRSRAAAGKRMKAGDFVLKKINPADRARLDSVFAEIRSKLFPTRSD